MKWLLETYGVAAHAAAVVLGVLVFFAAALTPALLAVEVSVWWLFLYVLYPPLMRAIIDRLT